MTSFYPFIKAKTLKLQNNKTNYIVQTKSTNYNKYLKSQKELKTNVTQHFSDDLFFALDIELSTILTFENNQTQTNCIGNGRLKTTRVEKSVKCYLFTGTVLISHLVITDYYGLDQMNLVGSISL